jgi:hypothetical protein
MARRGIHILRPYFAELLYTHSTTVETSNPTKNMLSTTVETSNPAKTMLSTTVETLNSTETILSTMVDTLNPIAITLSTMVDTMFHQKKEAFLYENPEF